MTEKEPNLENALAIYQQEWNISLTEWKAQNLIKFKLKVYLVHELLDWLPNSLLENKKD